ncbi:MAG: metallophosphoesterase [Clostridia bacterium]|nr:metallophosphoesterase [Clostridia bacterium]
MENEMLKTHPAVFAVEDEYQIMVCVKEPCLMWVQIGEEKIFDESNGMLRSNVTTHRMHVPGDLLNREKKYTLCWRKVIDRKPYFTQTEEEQRLEYSFRPVPEDKIIIYHVSDAHKMIDAPVTAARHFEKKYGKIDLLILNGDIPNHSGDISQFDTVYEIVSALTGGEIPTIFSRGNHDMRGVHAETFAEYTPNRYGNTYYTVRIGSIAAILLDCGEDKEDSCEAYGHTICCHQFRQRQTKWLRQIVDGKQFEDPSIRYKLVISHNPFPLALKQERFDIEQDIYGEWCSILKNEIQPDLLMAGHYHKQFVSFPGDERDDHLGNPCPVAVCCIPRRGDAEKGTVDYHAGAGFLFENGSITCCFADCNGVLSGEIVIK